MTRRYAWDGDRFRFVSDILGGGIIGYLVGPDEYYTPDTDEYLPLRQLAPTDAGRFVLQIGNQPAPAPAGALPPLDRRLNSLLSTSTHPPSVVDH